MAARQIKTPSTGIKTPDLTAQPTYASGKPPVPPELKTAPRDSGGMSTGKTGGNFNLKGMTSIGINPGAKGTQDVADDASDEFALSKSSTT